MWSDYPKFVRFDLKACNLPFAFWWWNLFRTYNKFWRSFRRPIYGRSDFRVDLSCRHGQFLHFLVEQPFPIGLILIVQNFLKIFYGFQRRILKPNLLIRHFLQWEKKPTSDYPTVQFSKIGNHQWFIPYERLKYNYFWLFQSPISYNTVRAHRTAYEPVPTWYGHGFGQHWRCIFV